MMYMLCVWCEGAVDVGALSSLDDSFKSLPYRSRATPTPLMPVIAAPAVLTRTSRTNLPSTVCRPTLNTVYCLMTTYCKHLGPHSRNFSGKSQEDFLSYSYLIIGIYSAKH